MKKAIGLRFSPYDAKKHGESFFLGDPIGVDWMVDGFDKTVMFLGIIKLSDIAALDKENKLPHKGYLYFFLDTKDTNRKLKPLVYHLEENPTITIDDFNNSPDILDECPGILERRGIEFVEVDENDKGTKLLGVPYDWGYEKAPDRDLLLTISHFDEGLDFLPFLDGFTYIFFGPKNDPFGGVKAFYEYS